ncbi:MAG: DUF3343 domain-containing protein [Ruminococcaceae bacterium]|nr:DUF3343 domain-containing protein [Oscillospiraceae bacterium]
MRQKTLKLVVTFHTTTAAMAMESACTAAGLPGRLIPVPREITAGCGMSWKAEPSDRAALEAFVKEKGITVAGWYELML